MRDETTDRWLSGAEIAEHLGVKPISICQWITRNGMPAHKMGRLLPSRVDEIDQWVKSGKGRNAVA